MDINFTLKERILFYVFCYTIPLISFPLDAQWSIKNLKEMIHKIQVTIQRRIKAAPNDKIINTYILLPSGVCVRYFPYCVSPWKNCVGLERNQTLDMIECE